MFSLYHQAQQLNSMLDAQEMNQGPGPNNMGVGGPIPGNLANNMGVGPINDMPLGGPGGNVGPVNCGPNGPQGGPNNNQRKNFNQGGGPGNRNFNQGPNNMNNQVCLRETWALYFGRVATETYFCMLLTRMCVFR